MTINNSWIQRKDFFIEEAKKIHKSIKLISTQSSFLIKIIAWLAYVFSFGKIKRNDFISNTAITIGNRIYIPEETSQVGVYRLIAHEGQHVKQFLWFGLCIHPLIGLPIGMLSYVFLPIPMFGALIRFFMELDACKTEWSKMIDIGLSKKEIQKRAENFFDILTGIHYFYPVPKWFGKKFYFKALENILGK